MIYMFEYTLHVKWVWG